MESLNKLAVQVIPGTAQKLGYAGCYLIELIKLKKKKIPPKTLKSDFTCQLAYKFEPLASSSLHLKVSLIDHFNCLEIKR